MNYLFLEIFIWFFLERKWLYLWIIYTTKPCYCCHMAYDSVEQKVPCPGTHGLHSGLPQSDRLWHFVPEWNREETQHFWASPFGWTRCLLENLCCLVQTHVRCPWLASEPDSQPAQLTAHEVSSELAVFIKVGLLALLTSAHSECQPPCGRDKNDSGKYSTT